jgi:hypothetical protein
MSSGLSMSSLNAAAAFLLRSLLDHPDRQTPHEIADAPHASGTVDAEAARTGLGELAVRGLAAEDSGGRWHLTDVGREAQQRA